MTKKYRGYVVANKGVGRVAMRDSGKPHPTRRAAVADIKRDNQRWMTKNYSGGCVKQAKFEYGSVEDGRFPDGSKGNKALLKWHNEKTGRVF